MEFNDRDLSKICSCALMQGVDPSDARDIFREYGCEIRSFSTGEIIFSPEQDQKKVGWLLLGKAVISTPDMSKHTLLRYLNVNEPFGVASLFSDAPYVSVIHAQKACRVFFLSEGAVRKLLESNPAFLYRYLEFLSGRIRFLNRKIGYLTAGSTERRLAIYLISQESDDFNLSVSFSDLSELLDVGRASLYRAFDKFMADGFIQKDGHRIRLINKEALLQAYQ